MKDISQATALVYDHGLFFPIAQRLAKKFKRVLYFSHWEKGFSTINDYAVGDGFGDIERCTDIWKVKNEVDIWVFPDIQHSGLQLELESQGKAVWGSRNGDSLELNRVKFNRVLREVGLPVAPFVVIKGLSELRKHLSDKTDKYIKISKYRGTMETWHWRDNDLDSGRLDALAVKLGPFQDHLPFLVVDPIECPIEIGGDTYCVDGKWPKLCLNGMESKDKCYFGAVTPFAEMPQELQDVMNAFSPILAKERYRNQWSMECRDGRFIDPTCRGGLPSTGSQIETWSNLPEIIWAGARGEMVEPIPAHQFSVESVLTLKAKKGEWGKIRVAPELVDHAKFASCCEIDGAICFPPDEQHSDDVGWLVNGGSSMEDAIDTHKKLARELPDGLSCASEELIDLLQKMQEAEDEGIAVSTQDVPNPERVVA